MNPILWWMPEWFPGFGGQAVYAYGVMLGLAMILGWYVTLWRVRRAGLEVSKAVWVLGTGLAVGMLGARALFFVSNPGRWHGMHSLWAFDSGGLVVYGGFLGGLLGALVAMRVLKVPAWRLLDLAAPQMALGLAVGRVGCFLYGCDFGTRSTLPWAVRFPRWGPEELPWAHQSCVQDADCGPWTLCDVASQQCMSTHSAAWRLHESLGYIGPGELWSAPVHPVQIYSACAALALGGLLSWRLKHQAWAGQVIAWWMVGYGLLRFALELVREDTMRGALWSGVVTSPLRWLLVAAQEPGGQVVHQLSTSQGVSVVLVVAGLLLCRRPHEPLKKVKVET